MSRTRSALQLPAALAAALSLSSVSSAQPLHDVDFLVREVDGKLDLGRIDTLPDNTQAFTFPSTVAITQLGFDGFPNVIDDPGFISRDLAFDQGTQFRLDILGALRQWDGEDFDGPASEAMFVSQGFSFGLTPGGSAEHVPGPVLGSADFVGQMHHHASFSFNSPGVLQEGVWLLQLQLVVTNRPIEGSDQVLIVLHQGADQAAAEAAGEAAFAWTTLNRTGPCRVVDTDKSGDADFLDVIELLSEYYRPVGFPTLTADMDRDLDNDVDDLVVFLDRLEESCDPLEG